MLSVVMVVRHLPMPIIQARVQGRGLEEDVVLVVLEDWVGGHQLEEHVSLSWPVVQGRSGVLTLGPPTSTGLACAPHCLRLQNLIIYGPVYRVPPLVLIAGELVQLGWPQHRRNSEPGRRLHEER